MEERESENLKQLSRKLDRLTWLVFITIIMGLGSVLGALSATLAIISLIMDLPHD